MIEREKQRESERENEKEKERKRECDTEGARDADRERERERERETTPARGRQGSLPTTPTNPFTPPTPTKIPCESRVRQLIGPADSSPATNPAPSCLRQTKFESLTTRATGKGQAGLHTRSR